MGQVKWIYKMIHTFNASCLRWVKVQLQWNKLFMMDSLLCIIQQFNNSNNFTKLFYISTSYSYSNNSNWNNEIERKTITTTTYKSNDWTHFSMYDKNACQCSSLDFALSIKSRKAFISAYIACSICICCIFYQCRMPCKILFMLRRMVCVCDLFVRCTNHCFVCFEMTVTKTQHKCVVNYL